MSVRRCLRRTPRLRAKRCPTLDLPARVRWPQRRATRHQETPVFPSARMLSSQPRCTPVMEVLVASSGCFVGYLPGILTESEQKDAFQTLRDEVDVQFHYFSLPFVHAENPSGALVPRDRRLWSSGRLFGFSQPPTQSHLKFRSFLNSLYGDNFCTDPKLFLHGGPHMYLQVRRPCSEAKTLASGGRPYSARH
jgi:hypothetical protein